MARWPPMNESLTRRLGVPMPRTDLMELSLNLTECISIRKTISENLNIEIRSQLVLGF